MNLDQYFALHVTSADAKVRYKAYQESKGQLDSLLEDLLANPEHPVNAEMLRGAIILVNRTSSAYLEALASLVMGET